jgi:rSAM/selenodomain-associated transferase 1
VTLRIPSRRPFALERSYRTGYTKDLIDLSSSAASSPLLEELMEPGLLRTTTLGYEPGGGSRELRAAVASLYSNLDPANVVITAGAVEAIRAVAMALVGPGHRVIVSDPAYGALRQAVLDAGGCPVTSDAALAFLNSPHGPTGAITRDVASIAERVVVDEVYRSITLVPGTTVPSCIDSSPRAVAIGDLSKPLGLGGLRIGWIASHDSNVIERCRDAVDYLSGSVSALSAAVALSALGRFDELLAPHLETARDNLATLAAFVEEHRAWLDWDAPQAGYTACLRLLSTSHTSQIVDGLRAAGIFLLDGATFGMPACLRIGLDLPRETFSYALDVLGLQLRRLPRTTTTEDGRAGVVVFTKRPGPGQGKSRLAADIGAENAAALATAFFHDTLRLQESEADRRYIAIASQPDVAELRSALPGHYVYPQRGADMGERLLNALDFALQHGAKRPVLIGSDSPTLPGHLVRMAHRALATHDAVLGPALDGGYYLIGLTRRQPVLFEGIEWSTERVLQQTLDRARAAGLSVFCLPYWYDVDTAADIERLRRDAHPGSDTRDALQRIAVQA